MSYDAIFEAGSLNGRRWRIPEGGTLVIGRSHSCGIRPDEPDVSGRHMVVGVTDGKAWMESLSAHRTEIDGARLATGERRVVSGEPLVRLGGRLAFRIREVADEDDATGDISQGETSTFGGATRTHGGGTTTVGTAATRAVPDVETGIFGTESVTGLGETAGTQATHADGTGTFATAATRAMPDDTGTLTGGQYDDETQMLHTQVASREELEKLKAIYEKKRKSRVAKRVFLLGAAALAALGAGVILSGSPELELDEPQNYETEEILPALCPEDCAKDISGSVTLYYPSDSAILTTTGNTVTVKSMIGRKHNVELAIVVEVFRDRRALTESRWDTMRRYFENSEDLVSLLDSMRDQPDEEFFGGEGGLHRGVPCSRFRYRRMNGRQALFGIVSLFRYGDICCAVRREVPDAESSRAMWLIESAEDYLATDSRGAFGASQWEGGVDAGCADPSLEIARCKARFAVDSPAEWPDMERGIRDILVSTADEDEYSDIYSGARKLLVDLRTRKVLHWKSLTTERVRLVDTDSPANRRFAAELDETVRNDFRVKGEEWEQLARRPEWWRED